MARHQHKKWCNGARPHVELHYNRVPKGRERIDEEDDFLTDFVCDLVRTLCAALCQEAS